VEPAVSIVIPCYNEEGSVKTLADKLVEVLARTGKPFEILFVDDGSNDGTLAALESLNESDTRIKFLSFRRNFGKAAGLSAGFAEARGDVVFTMDADLQDDPEEIPAFLAKLDEGFDLVSGWKKKRNDPVGKTLPSKLFNKVTAKLTGVPLHDFNCGFKVYRKEVLSEIDLYGEMHRYIPVLAHNKGFSVAELPVKHHPRTTGKSKYGLERYLRGATDLLTILFLTRYTKSPAHFFGGSGLLTSGAGFFICLYLSALWFMGARPIGNRPLLFLGILLIITGVQLFSIGLIGEMLTKAGAKDQPEYSIKTRRT
jgi:glycosyltransferase involved in cell wall biosynthesis